MDQLLEFFRNLGSRFNEQSQGKKIATLVLVAFGIASLFLITLWTQKPDMQLLYANLSPGDAAAIADNLKSQKVDYELTNQGRTIWVPNNRLHEIRLQLAGEGLPAGSEVGLEIFEETPLGMTEFVQKLNFQRALQGELVRTINTLDAIEQARVHLVIPKDTLFLKEKPEGKASVMIKIKPGKSLTKAQAQGIVHLVSASVEGVNARSVVILDLEGNLLSGGGKESEDAMLTGANFQHKMRVEKGLQNKIERMLEQALGSGKVIAHVTADLDFERIERTEEIFDPDSQVARSEQAVTETTVGAVPPGGVPGIPTLTPAGEGGPVGQPASRNKENTTFNYEINKVIQQVSKPTGEIKNLSVAVLIDGTIAGEPPQYKARSREEMDKFTKIVQSAVGYNPKRGDKIQVENVQFDRSFTAKQREEMDKAEQFEFWFEFTKYALLAVFILLFFARIIRPLVNWMTTTVEVVPEGPPQISAAELEAAEGDKEPTKDAAAEAAEIRQSVNEFVQADPKFSANIIRKWMREKPST